jgi:polyribonucleotide nucleotidyltransferase
MENDPDVVAMIGTSAALTISGLPFLGPIGAARVGYKDGEYLLNPSIEAIKESDLDLVVAGTRDGVMMVESEASELSEEIMLGAVKFGHEQFQGVLDLIIELAEEAAKEPRDVAGLPEGYDALVEKIAALGTEGLTAAYAHVVKQERSAAVAAAKADIIEKLGDDVPDELKGKVSSIIKDLEKDIVRGAILKTGKRIDGRTGADVRPIMGEVSVLPRSHGSSIFTRGETQALAVVTLGTGQDEQIVDALDGEYRESFMLHYNFPPYSVGEAGRMGSPGRREIGHGKLAWRALHPLMPSKDVFPYTTRIVSEVTESNGSSSMATVCASSLAMMDAGVPLARPVAGIAMGLIKEADDFAVLSDIMGDEDHLGDMDFKVAGTENGITSLQMDIKITSVTPEIMQIALKQARDGRIHILGEMAKALPEARGEVSGNAPTITQFSIPKDKIRDVIGSGGKVIREICEETGAKVDIEDDGSITVAHTDGAKGKQAVDWIKSIVAEPELNHIYDGKVVKAVDFGAFVNFFGARDGLVHISELAPERVKQVSDIVKEGDQVKVKVIGFDDRGKIKLSMKRVDQETGADLDAGDAE